MTGHALRRPLAWPLGGQTARHWMPLAAAVSLAVGAATAYEPLLGVAVTAGLVAGVAMALGGVRTFVGLGLASLPWLVVFDSLVPPLVKTFTAAIVAICLLCAAWDDVHDKRLVLGVALLLLVVLIGVFREPGGPQLVQASKYTMFPIMAMVAVLPRAQARLRSLGPMLIASCAGSMIAHLVVIAVGAGAVGSYYGTGERLGFAAKGPHELALLAVLVAAAGFACSTKTFIRYPLVLLGIVPALATGVRTALAAIVVILVVAFARARFSPRQIVLVCAIAAMVVASGGLAVTQQRFLNDEGRGEYASLSTAGSGRGAIWSTALEHYAAAGPAQWVAGTGLRSITRFEKADLGGAFVGHSDLIEVGVQLGVIGLVGWLLIWLSLLRSGLSRVILAPVAVYGVLNGAIEAVGPIVLAIALASAYGRPQQARDTRAPEPQAGRAE